VYEPIFLLCKSLNKKDIETFQYVLISFLHIQSDQKENKSEQALQIIGHVVAEFYTNKRSMIRQFVQFVQDFFLIL
jgi:hypothetical protein